MKLDFSEISKIDTYQEVLEKTLDLLDSRIKELQEVRRTLIPERSALIIEAKSGVYHKGTMVKPSNAEERNALVNYKLSEKVSQEQNFEDEIDYLKEKCRSYRQLISAEQTKLQLSKIEAQSIGYGQHRGN